MLVQLVDRRRALADAVAAPRIHVEDDCLSIERQAGEVVLDALAGRWQRRNVFDQPNFYFGGVHGVMTGPGQLAGAGDPRRAGVFMSMKD
ncbi:MAG: gamma-glutamyltransferase [Gammaproteobacteria bacterium]|nr:gamma-glutamyltransferase [Gammaproteobacteria bacterium]